MTDKQKLVVIVTNGFNDERSSVAWSVANGATGSDMDVTMFLVSSGVDWLRKRAANQARLNPLDPPVRDMIQTVVDNGGKILVRPPCAGLRGYEGGCQDEGDVVSLLNEQPDEFLCWWANPEREFFNNVLGETIMSAIASLPEAFRITVLLGNVEGLTCDDAAEARGVCAGTIRSRMKRGRTMLQ